MGSRSCHPASSEGFLPNNDLMEFLASTTFGACLGSAPEVDNGYDYRMNVYHQLFLTWGFHKSLYLPTQSVFIFLTYLDTHIVFNNLIIISGARSEKVVYYKSMLWGKLYSSSTEKRKWLSSQLSSTQRFILSITRRIHYQRGILRLNIFEVCCYFCCYGVCVSFRFFWMTML